MRATVLFNPMKGYILKTSFSYSPRIPAITTAISNINPSPLDGRRSYVSKPICYNLTAQPRACSPVNPNGVAGDHVRRYASSAMARDVSEMKQQLSDIPSTLTTDTLLKLPLETMLRCRYVCKAWDGFFTDPEFVKRQLAASPIHFLEQEVEEDRAIHFGRVVEVDGKLHSQTVDFTPRLLDLPDPTYRCVNSSNGLLCLVGRHDGSIFVCNPLLGESVYIPEPVNYKGGDRSVAIGFSAKDGLYKVLVGYQLEENNYGFEIYTLGTREWRVVDSVEGCRPWHINGMDFNTFLHGSLHWVSVGVSTDGSRVRSLWSFNFETEKFQRFEFPDPRTSPRHDTCTAHYTEIKGEDDDLDVQLGIMNGRLWVCFCDNNDPTEADIWVMKEYGVKDSWNQILAFRDYIPQIETLCPSGFIMYGYDGYAEFDCDVTHPRLLFSFSQKDIVIPDEKDPGKSHSIHVEKVLIADDSGALICYDTKKWCDLVVEFNTSSSHTYDFGRVTAYFPSFVSLQDAAKGEKVSRAEVSYNEGGGEGATCQWIK